MRPRQIISSRLGTMRRGRRLRSGSGFLGDAATKRIDRTGWRHFQDYPVQSHGNLFLRLLGRMAAIGRHNMFHKKPFINALRIFADTKSHRVFTKASRRTTFRRRTRPIYSKPGGDWRRRSDQANGDEKSGSDGIPRNRLRTGYQTCHFGWTETTKKLRSRTSGILSETMS